MRRTALDTYDDMPRDMKAYLRQAGWHFNKKACTYAVSLMKKYNPTTNKKEGVEMMTKEQVDTLLSKFAITLENNVGYDYVFVANMCKADYCKSIPDEQHMALFIKETIDDIDAGDGVTMRRWYATMVANGEPIDWEELI